MPGKINRFKNTNQKLFLAIDSVHRLNNADITTANAILIMKIVLCILSLILESMA